MLARRLFAAALALGLALTFAAPTQAQVLNDTWFVLKVSGKGYLIDDGSGEATKTKFKTTAYMHVLSEPVALKAAGDPPSQSYDIFIWTQVDGEWDVSYSGSWELFGTDDLLFVADVDPAFYTGPTSYFAGYHTAEIKNKFDKEGHLKKSTYKSLGAELIEGTETGAESAIGGYSIKGKSIDPSKLPFDPALFK